MEEFVKIDNMGQWSIEKADVDTDSVSEPASFKKEENEPSFQQKLKDIKTKYRVENESKEADPAKTNTNIATTDVERKKLTKAWLKPGEEHEATPDPGKKAPHVALGSGKKGVGRSKDIETKRKELIDNITQHDLAPGGAHEGVPADQVREMHEFNHSSGEISDKEVHSVHKKVFPKQY